MKHYSKYLLLILLLGIAVPYSVAVPMHELSHLVDFHDKTHTADKCDLCQLTQGTYLFSLTIELKCQCVKQTVISQSTPAGTIISFDRHSNIRAPPTIT